MSVIYKTTIAPTKLELLTEWLPKQPWYEGAGTPQLERAGGFRLDDPAGEAGMEFMVVVDQAGPAPVAYFVPLTYRGAPAPDVPEKALVGTMEHGVLGTRWAYDGARDPMLTTQLRALLRREATPQAQSISDTDDPTVHVHGTAPEEPYEVQINRILQPNDKATAAHVEAGWTWPDGTAARAVFAQVGAA